jgi:hypothetical protein
MAAVLPSLLVRVLSPVVQLLLLIVVWRRVVSKSDVAAVIMNDNNEQQRLFIISRSFSFAVCFGPAENLKFENQVIIILILRIHSRMMISSFFSQVW